VKMDQNPFARGDYLIIPQNNTNAKPASDQLFKLVTVMQYEYSPFLTTSNLGICSGFYSDFYGPLPYAFGYVPDDQYGVLQYTATVNPIPFFINQSQ
jgi:hypothetical protein